MPEYKKIFQGTCYNAVPFLDTYHVNGWKITGKCTIKGVVDKCN